MSKRRDNDIGAKFHQLGGIVTILAILLAYRPPLGHWLCWCTIMDPIVSRRLCSDAQPRPPHAAQSSWVYCGTGHARDHMYVVEHD
jgi:hypothetical protein